MDATDILDLTRAEMKGQLQKPIKKPIKVFRACVWLRRETGYLM